MVVSALHVLAETELYDSVNVTYTCKILLITKYCFADALETFLCYISYELFNRKLFWTIFDNII
jgi:hypothetical protein